MLASYQGRKSQQPFGSSILPMINILVYFVRRLVSTLKGYLSDFLKKHSQ